MTRFQRLLYAVGFSRFKAYRRWVGGRWAERYSEATPHSSEWPYWSWEQDPCAQRLIGKFTRAIEQWPPRLPVARARHRDRDHE